MKILVVEDDRSIQMVLELVLTRVAKCEVALATEGPEGLAKIREIKPDLVLLDLMLPGMDGFQICEKVKADDATRQIPVIFLTAQRKDASSIERGLELGADEYLTKPIEGPYC